MTRLDRWLPRTNRRGAVVVATYFLLCILPVAFAGQHSGMRVWWFASSLALATGVLWLCWRGGAARFVALALNAVTALGNVSLVVSLLIQETGFNAQYFHHMEWETLLAVREAYAPLAVTAAVYLAVVCVWPALLPAVSHSAPSRRATAAVLVAAVALNAAFLSLVSHMGTELARSLRIVLVPKPHRTATAPPTEEAGARDLVIVVAESLEATYARSDFFGADLTPALTSLEADGVAFTDMRQVSHTGWTMGAVVAASCGIPMVLQDWWDRERLHAEVRLPGTVCLGDVLEAHGYRTVVMVGHRLAFADTSGFFAAHGFAEQHGLNSLREHLADPSYLSGWGLYDDSLLALARDRLRELAAGDAPFALMVLTMDTHFPPGHPSASCGTPSDPDDRAFVIRCADRLLASFVEDVRGMVPDAVVALYSDHLSRESPRRAGLLAPGAAADALADATNVLGFFGGAETHSSRRLRFAVWDPTRPAGTVDRPGTHFDIMPTVLDFVGIEGWAVHGFGASLLRGSSPWLAHPSPDALQIVHDLPSLHLSPGEEVLFDARGPTIEIDGERLLATGRGLTFEDAVFVVALAEDGAVQVLDADAFEAVVGGDDVPVVVGISSQREASRHLLLAAGARTPPASELVFFLGRPGTAGFVAGPLPRADDHPTVRIALPSPSPEDGTR